MQDYNRSITISFNKPFRKLIVIINPYNRTIPMLALKALTNTTGPGCGGKKQCVVDNEAAIGITRYNKGNFVFLASVKTNGTNMMKPAL